MCDDLCGITHNTTLIILRECCEAIKIIVWGLLFIRDQD